MDYSFGNSTQAGGWKCPVVTTWIGELLVRANIDTECSESLI